MYRESPKAIPSSISLGHLKAPIPTNQSSESDMVIGNSPQHHRINSVARPVCLVVPIPRDPLPLPLDVHRARQLNWPPQQIICGQHADKKRFRRRKWHLIKLFISSSGIEILLQQMRVAIRRVWFCRGASYRPLLLLVWREKSRKLCKFTCSLSRQSSRTLLWDIWSIVYGALCMEIARKVKWS